LNSIVPGAYTALVTPFCSDGSIDDEALKRLVDFQLAGGIDGFALCGCTGEEATLNLEDRRHIVGLIREHVDTKIPIIAGGSSNATASAVAFAKGLEAVGADAILSVVPYYNKPNPKGIVAHFTAVADAIEIPVVLSNVPGRTGCPLIPETALHLAEHPNIVAIDEGSGDMDFTMAILKDAPDGFLVFSGEDSLIFPLVALGAAGALSLISNEVPARVSRMVHETLAGHVGEARRLHYEILELAGINYIDSNPMPVKAALAMMGLIEENLRLPMLPLDADKRAVVESELRKLKLIDSR
jgi:4-hydroxy-tetrahydrodipicolinate synthase